MAEMPSIDGKKCNGCGLCIDVCPCNALVLQEKVANVVQTDECNWCTQCETVCPTGAIACPFEVVLG